MIEKLPESKATIGIKEVVNGIKNNKIKTVVVASNCPDFLKEKLKIKFDVFQGDQQQLGTSLGKPFPVAVVGYE